MEVLLMKPNKQVSMKQEVKKLKADHVRSTNTFYWSQIKYSIFCPVMSNGYNAKSTILGMAVSVCQLAQNFWPDQNK